MLTNKMKIADAWPLNAVQCHTSAYYYKYVRVFGPPEVPNILQINPIVDYAWLTDRPIKQNTIYSNSWPLFECIKSTLPQRLIVPRMHQ